MFVHLSQELYGTLDAWSLGTYAFTSMIGR
jgi:hypothetical protein